MFRCRPIVLALLISTTVAHAHADCPPTDWNREALVALKGAGFEVADNAARATLANALADCLADKDPLLRDGIAFEAYATWLRRGKLADDQVVALSRRLLAEVASETPDPDGIRRAFAALVLSELARTDRVKPHFPEDLRTDMVRTAIDYMMGIRDYRGYEERLGWRHGVAHTADWLMQLSLNPAYGKGTLDEIRSALLAQVRAHGQHAFTDGESERLARAVLVVMTRTELDAASWHIALRKLAEPSPMASWNEAWSSRRGLDERHNLRLFLLSLRRGVTTTELPDRETTLATIDEALTATD